MRGRPRDSPRGRRLEHRVHPRRLLRQQQGRRPHAIARGIESRRRHAPGPERDGGVEQTLPHADDADVRPAQSLERAVVISLALGDGLVLRAHTRHAEELPYALGLPVREVIVGAALDGPDVAVGLAGLRRVVHHVDARAGAELGDFIGSQSARRVVRDAPVDEVIVVDRDPNVRVDDGIAAHLRGRHAVKRNQVPRDAPVVLARRGFAPRADQQAGLGVRHLDVRRPLELGREAEAGSRLIERAPQPVIARVEDAVKERDVGGIDAALERRGEVAVMPDLRDDALIFRNLGPLEVGQRGRRARRAHVGPDDTSPLRARIRGMGDLVLEARLRPLVGHVDATPARLVLPTVIDTAQPRLLVPAEVERGAPVRAELPEQAHPSARRPEGHEVLAPFFGDRLADARISSVPMSSPAWYSDLLGRGVDQRDLLDFSNLVAITFNTAVNLLPDAPEPTMGLLFHEFVHVLQYRLLGVQEFARRYVDGWLAGKGFLDRPDLRYVYIPLERQAYDLQARFAAAPDSAFSVEAALQQETATA